MILVKKNNTLIYKEKKYRCSLGKNGLNKAKTEGDKCTPIGLFSFGSLYVRTDRIKKLKTNFKYIPISKNNYSSTQGCIGLNQDDFAEILLTLKPADKIKIIED